MADKRFFKVEKPMTIGQIVELVAGSLPDGVNPDILIEDVAALDKAGAKDISFLDNKKYRKDFERTSARACLVSEKNAVFAPKGTIPVISKNPYKAYAIVAGTFYPPPASDSENISSGALIDKSAKIGKNCTISYGAVIKDNAEIGDNCIIEANAVIGSGVVIGNRCRVGPCATIERALIGNNVRLYPGVRVGQDGFGFAIDSSGFTKIPQLGRVIIEGNSEIGAGTCIDRGAGPDTVIGAGTWIDNLVQIGHNVKVGKGCVIVSQAGIAGSCVIDDFVMIGGQAGVAGHLRVGKGAKIAAHSGIYRDVDPGAEMMGYPAVPLRSFMRQVALLKKMVKK